MNFIIKQNATLPILSMKLIEVIDTTTLSLNLSFDNMMENAVVTFSMIDVETGRYAIANKSGGITKIEDVATCGCDNCNYIIYYQFTDRDTKNYGVYKGEFTINFFDGDNGNGKLILPMKNDLNIFIQETYGKTSINGF